MPDDGLMHVEIKPEGPEEEGMNQPPSYRTEESDGSGLIILSLDENNRVFIPPGFTHNVRSP